MLFNSIVSLLYFGVALFVLAIITIWTYWWVSGDGATGAAAAALAGGVSVLKGVIA